MNITESLHEIQKHLGSSYYRIGECIQLLKNEVDNSLSESETVISEFRNNLKSSDKNSLSNVILLFEETVGEAQKTFSGYSEEFLFIMSKVFESFEVLNRMHEPVGQIIDSAEQMELLALNAMVVAIQAGNQGGGFTYITEEFQKNAKLTFTLAKNLNNQRSVVTDQYDSLKIKSNEMLEMQKNISKDISSTLSNDFKSLKKTISNSVDFIGSLHTEAQNLKPSVFSVIEGIQNQDIIRQSIDHILMSLREMDKIEQECSSDEKTVMNRQLYELCLYVLDEVIEQIIEDENILLKNFKSIERLLTDLDERKNSFSKEQTSGGSENRTGLIASLERISDSFRKIISGNEYNRSFETEILKLKNRLFSSVIMLHDFISAFNKPVTLFNNTIVLARIEIARQPVIRSVEISINDIDKETVVISNAASEIENMHSNFIISNSSIDTQLKKLIEKNAVFNINFKNDIMKLIELSEKFTVIFKRLLSGLVFMNKNYISIFNDIENDIEYIKKTRIELEKIKEELHIRLKYTKDHYKLIEKEKAELLKNNGKINELLGKFTIFRHKEKLLNNEISENSAADSSITLF